MCCSHTFILQKVRAKPSCCQQLVHPNTSNRQNKEMRVQKPGAPSRFPENHPSLIVSIFSMCSHEKIHETNRFSDLSHVTGHLEDPPVIPGICGTISAETHLKREIIWKSSIQIGVLTCNFRILLRYVKLKVKSARIGEFAEQESGISFKPFQAHQGDKKLISWAFHVDRDFIQWDQDIKDCNAALYFSSSLSSGRSPFRGKGLLP